MQRIPHLDFRWLFKTESVNTMHYNVTQFEGHCFSIFSFVCPFTSHYLHLVTYSIGEGKTQNVNKVTSSAEFFVPAFCIIRNPRKKTVIGIRQLL